MKKKRKAKEGRKEDERNIKGKNINRKKVGKKGEKQWRTQWENERG